MESWKPEIELIKRLADEAVRRLPGALNPAAVIREVAKAVPREHRGECVTAIAHELSMRQHLKEARALPDALSTAPAPRPESKQPGFGFGEGPRVKIRPPTRRHL